MPTEISWEIRERAEGLYIIDGLTYEQTAARTGVSVTQLKRWGADGGWGERRAEYRRELSDIRRGTVQLRAKLLRKVLDSPEPDPQDVYAFARIEQVAAAAAAKTQPEAPGAEICEGVEQRAIQTPEDAVAALGEALQKKINGMLTSPAGVDLAGIKEVRQCLELIGQMRAQMAPEETADPSDRALDAKTIRSIREQLSL
ncbi:MAG TPA: hypothetical protein DC063_00210 [Arenimonas sp.]|nr:hypothetical protein [Arenimonas sp.]